MTVSHPPQAPGASGDPAGRSTGTPPPADEAARELAAQAQMAVVERAKAGDGQAFAELYDSYVGLVYRYIHFRVASRQLAEDLTADTFLRALRSIGSFNWQGRDIGAWFVTIARNLVADHYRSSRYRLELVTEDVSLVTPLLAVSGPESEVLTRLQDATLLQAVRRLGAEQQECVALRFMQGMSVAETAKIMGKNEASIKSLQYRAIKTLGRLLQGVDL